MERTMVLPVKMTMAPLEVKEVVERNNGQVRILPPMLGVVLLMKLARVEAKHFI
jgi:hypothetical protein